MAQPTQRKKKKGGGKSSSSVGSMSEQNGELSVSTKKSKKFSSRVRRIFTGKSKKKKSKGSKYEESPSQAEDSSHVGILDINTQREVVTTLGDEKKPYILKVALLLVDSLSRRFELLQLEFDSETARVNDALSQIAVHVTEKVLSDHVYEGVCNADAIMKGKTEKLFTFCTGNDVLVAVPAGTAGSDCARLASPILNDDKVLAMLNASGIDASPWKKKIASKERTIHQEAKQTKPLAPDGKMHSMKELLLYMVFIVVVCAAVLQVYSTPGLVGPEQTWFKQIQAPGVPDVWDTCRSICDAGENVVQQFVVRKSEEVPKVIVE